MLCIFFTATNHLRATQGKLMKHISRLAVIAALLSLSAKAAPFMAVGDGAELFVTAGLSVAADDNVFLDSANEQDDTIISFTPGVDLVFGKGSATTGNVYYREEIRRYSDNDNQDGEFSNVGFRSSTNAGSGKFDINGSYAQIAQNDNDIRAAGIIVRRDVTNLGASAEFDVTGKTSLAVGTTFLSTKYDVATYRDSDVWSLPVDLYYEATEKLDWSVGYRYRTTDQDGAARDFKDHFVNIGARGEFSPKLTGQVRVGYLTRKIDGGGDESDLGLDSSFDYAATEKTSLRLFLSNDYGNSGTGDSTKTLRWGGSVNTNFTEQWFASASLSLSSAEYPTRDDDFLDTSVTVGYKYNQFVNFTASVAMRDNDSTAATAKFDNTVFQFGANIRY
jgi:polysaccharide biosynthesis protein VpsM